MFYIIIRGPLGIGKSTVANKLTKLLNAKYISYDKVLEENGLDKINNDFTPEDFIKANEIVIPDSINNLKNGKIVIFDGCFYFKEQIKHLKKKLPFKGFTFSLKAPVDTCIERDSKRTRVYGEQAAREVYELLSVFDYGISINTDKKTVDQVIKEVLSFLPKN